MPQDSVPQTDSPFIVWRTTSHLRRILDEGRNRPPPSVGSPALVWHIGVWRKHNHPRTGRSAPSQSYVDEYEQHNAQFFKEISDFLLRLQSLGVESDGALQHLQLEPIAIEGRLNDRHAVDPRPYRFNIFPQQSASFTLWWRDSATNGTLNTRLAPDAVDKDQALKVLVQFQSFQDYITITFYIDGAKRFSGKQIHAPTEGSLGVRRSQLSFHLDNIRRCAHEQIVSGSIELAPPADAGSPQAWVKLKAATDYLFDGIWNEFQSSFGFTTRSEKITVEGHEPTVVGHELNEGVIFINQRGLVMSIRGLKTDEMIIGNISVMHLLNETIFRFLPNNPPRTLAAARPRIQLHAWAG